MAVAHREGDKACLDLIREVRPPFSPESVVTEFCNTLKPYRVSRVQGDRYAGEWPREQFKKRGVNYLPAGKVKSDLYKELLAPINSGQVELLDNDRLKAQLVGLERRTARGGKDSIDHAPGGHDDIANCAAGALWLVLHAARHTQQLGMIGEVMYGDGPGVNLNDDPSLRDYQGARVLTDVHRLSGDQLLWVSASLKRTSESETGRVLRDEPARERDMRKATEWMAKVKRRLQKLGRRNG